MLVEKRLFVFAFNPEKVDDPKEGVEFPKEVEPNPEVVDDPNILPPKDEVDGAPSVVPVLLVDPNVPPKTEVAGVVVLEDKVEVPKTEVVGVGDVLKKDVFVAEVSGSFFCCKICLI
jgi:hypothetical protein